MKSASFEFDRLVHRFLCQKDYLEFTTRQLRDAYAASLPAGSFQLADVRIYVYEQIRRLVSVGWVERAEERQKRGQVFRVLDKPTRLDLILVDSCFSSAEITEKAENAQTPERSALDPEADNQSKLQVMLKEARLDLLCSIGETERYKLLFQQMPQLQRRLESEYLEARDRSSRLLGHLRAIENTLTAISAA